MRVSKLVNGSDISLKKYNLVNIFINSNNFKAYFNENEPLANNTSQSILLKPIFLSIETIVKRRLLIPDLVTCCSRDAHREWMKLRRSRE